MTLDSVTGLRHFGTKNPLVKENNVVVTTTTEFSDKERRECVNGVIPDMELRNMLDNINNKLNKLEKLEERIVNLETIFFSNSATKAQKLQKIKELCELNQEVGLEIVKTELRITAENYARKLMKEAAKQFELVFVSGVKGQGSFLTKRRPDNKAMHAYAETYQELLTKPLGSSTCVSAIARKFDLNGQELQSVICHLVRHHELMLERPLQKIGERRIKRVG